MKALAWPRSADPRACEGVAPYPTWAAALLTTLLALGLAEPTGAQDATAGEPSAATTAPAWAAEIAGIGGVKPGMTAEELIALAGQAKDGQRLDDALKILLAVARHEPQNVQALRLLGDVWGLQADKAAADSGDPDAKTKSQRYLTTAINTYLYAAPIAAEAGGVRVAEEMYNAVLARESGNPRALSGLAETAQRAMAAGDMAAAERMYNTILLNRPTYPQAQLGLARLMVATDRSLQAQEKYKAYVNTLEGRQDSQAFLELGRVYRTLRLRNLAVETLEKARPLNAANPEILIELAGAYQDANTPEKAVTLAEEATRNAPDNAAYHNVYAIILMDQSASRVKQVQTRLAAGATASPAQEQARQVLLTDLNRARQEAKQAITLGVQALAGSPDSQELLSSLSGYYATYRTVLRTILSIQKVPGVEEPSLADRIELAQVIQKHAAIFQTMNLHQALAVLTEAGEKARDDVPYLEELARLQFEVYKREDAAATCRRLLERQPDNAVAKGLLNRLGAAGKDESGGPGG